MFDDLRELYQEVILDHGRNPRNFRHANNATCSAHGNNPICGDMLVVYLCFDDDGVLEDAAVQNPMVPMSDSSGGARPSSRMARLH